MSGFLWRVAALGSLGAGLMMLARGAGPTSLAILLLVAGLAASGVLLGGGPHGPEAEGRLDLSARIGLGLLGGTLGAVASGLLRIPLVELGIAEAIGVTLPSIWTGSDALRHLGSGAVWGMVLGILYAYVPGARPASRGALFSLVPSLYLLLKTYPVDLGAGLFGVELGALAFAVVLLLNLVWGAVAGATVGWGETAEEAPVARPIDA